MELLNVDIIQNSMLIREAALDVESPIFAIIQLTEFRICSLPV